MKRIIVGGLLHVFKKPCWVLKGVAYASRIGGLFHVLHNSNQSAAGYVLREPKQAEVFVLLMVGVLLHLFKKPCWVLKGVAYASRIGGLFHILHNSNQSAAGYVLREPKQAEVSVLLIVGGLLNVFKKSCWAVMLPALEGCFTSWTELK